MYKKIFPKKEGEKYLIAEYIFLFNRIQSQINNLLLIKDNSIKKYIFHIFKYFIYNYNCSIAKKNDIKKLINLIK